MIRALGAAKREAEGGAHRVPPHLRDAHYRGAAKLGHGNDYAYPHDDPEGARDQRYLPEGARGGYVDRES